MASYALPPLWGVASLLDLSVSVNRRRCPFGQGHQSGAQGYSDYYGYDVLGNVTSNSHIGDNYDYASAVSGCAPGTPARKPHAVTTVLIFIYPITSFAYDCNGMRH